MSETPEPYAEYVRPKMKPLWHRDRLRYEWAKRVYWPWLSFRNWRRRLRWDAIGRCRYCDHTTPSHYPTCRTEVPNERREQHAESVAPCQVWGRTTSRPVPPRTSSFHATPVHATAPTTTRPTTMSDSAESVRPCDCKFCQHNAEKRCECEPCQYIRRKGWDAERSHPPLLIDGSPS